MEWLMMEKIGVRFRLALLTLVVIGIVCYRSTTRLIAIPAQVARIHKVLEKLESVLSRMVDTESNQLCYIKTGQKNHSKAF